MRLNDEQRQMAEQNIGLAYKMAHKYANRYVFLEFEDILSICMESLMMATVKHDAERGKFSTFACVCMKSKLMRANDRKAKRKIEGCSLDDELHTSDAYTLPFDEQIANKILLEQIYGDMENILLLLPSRHRDLIRLMLNNPYMSQAELAKLVGYTQPYISKIKQNMAKKLREALAS